MRKERETSPFSECPSAYKLDAAGLFGVDADTAKHLEHCSKCAAMRREMAAADEEFNTQVLPRTINSIIEQVSSEQKIIQWNRLLVADRGIRWRRAVPIAAAAMVAVIVGFLLWERPAAVTKHDEEYIGDKGTIGFEVWCKRNETVFRVHQGARLRADDRVRFVPRFASEDPLFLMVVSVDGNGTVSRYFPESSDAAARVRESGAPLPGSTILDATKGPERVWLLSSDEVFYFQDVQKAAEGEWRRAGAADRMDAVPVALDQASLLFIKEGEE